jgi:hypothetical protein
LKKTAAPKLAAPPTKQLAGFISKFDPKMGKLIRTMRQVLRKRYPSANELVYDNYNFFVIGFCTTERPSDCMFSLAANAKGVGLSFYYGSTLPDPHKVLQGSGSQNRFVRLPDVATISQPEVMALLQAAVTQAKSPLPSTGGGKLIIRSVSAKQRPRRDHSER